MIRNTRHEGIQKHRDTGRWIRKPTLEDARQAAIEEAGKLVQEGLQAVALTRDQRLDAVRAINVLSGAATLEAAAEFFMRHTVSGHRGKLCREVVSDLLATKRAANRRPDTISDAAMLCLRPEFVCGAGPVHRGGRIPWGGCRQCV